MQMAYAQEMRTTVDLDPGLLDKAKRQALGEQRTLSAVLNDALVAYLGARRMTAKDPPFEVLVRGHLGGRFPTAAELLDVEEAEDIAALEVQRVRRRAAP